MPSGSDDYISPLERNLLSLYGSESFALYDEADSKGDVTVGRGRLAWVYQLETAVDGVCSVR